MKVLLWLLLLEILWGCGMNRPESWPWRGSDMCVINATHSRLDIYAQRPDSARLLVWSQLVPGARARFKWPWIHAEGKLLAGNRVVEWWTDPFLPWTESYWTWVLGEDPDKALTASRC